MNSTHQSAIRASAGASGNANVSVGVSDNNLTSGKQALIGTAQGAQATAQPIGNGMKSQAGNTRSYAKSSLENTLRTT